MYKYSLLDNPIAIFILLLFVMIINIFLPVHFLSLLLIGVIYTVFTKSLEKEYYNSLAFMIVAFSVIELAQGLKLFSLSLLAFFIHIFISPLLKKTLTSEKLVSIMVVFLFYLGTIILFSFLGDISYELGAILLINYFIDIIILGILL
ncbi:MAG: hypothetical protein PHF17_08210 [Arcobacteraceae bacterium]|jgi:hypothetical protein|nr:hypothetical protein [Arcobacteraceae bacterium]